MVFLVNWIWVSKIHLLVRVDHAGTDHGTEAKRQAADADDPGVRDHEAVDEAVLDHLAGGEADDADAEARVEEGGVEVLALKERHAAVLAGLAVEGGVDEDEGAAEDGAADGQLAQRRGAVGGRLRLVPAPAAGAGQARDERRGGGGRARLGRGPREGHGRLAREEGMLAPCGLVEGARGGGLRGGCGELWEAGGQAGGALAEGYCE